MNPGPFARAVSHLWESQGSHVVVDVLLKVVGAWVAVLLLYLMFFCC